MAPKQARMPIFYLSQVSKGEIKKQKREKYYAPEVLSPRGVEGD
jgi:hypothetical protein